MPDQRGPQAEALQQMLAEYDDGTESLWAERTSGGRFRVRSIPFFISQLYLDDVVDVDERDGRFYFRCVSAPGGHCGFRVRVADEIAETDFVSAWTPLQRLGCSYEGVSAKFLAIDVPPTPTPAR